MLYRSQPFTRFPCVSDAQARGSISPDRSSRQRRLGPRFAAFVAYAGGALTAPAVTAQTASEEILEYCYNNICSSKLEKAIEAMEAAHPDYRGLFREVDKRVQRILPDKERPLWFVYGVDPRKPAAYLPSTYGAHWGTDLAPTYCAASGDPIFPNYCASDTAFIQGYVDWYVQRYDANRVRHSVDIKGGYVMPFAEITSGGTADAPLGLMMHNNWRNRSQMPSVTVTIYKENGTVASGHGDMAELTRFTTFRCLKGFYAKTGAHPAYNPTTWQPVSEATCLPMVANQTITTRVRQSACPYVEQINQPEGNPCHPATGDKSQFEIDAEFAGRAFGRTYHSLGQAEQRRQLAPRWVHSYSDRISGLPAGSEPLVLTDERGYIDVFVRQGSSSRYLSETGNDKVLDVGTDGKLVLTDKTGLVRRFDSSGRLTRLERGGSAWSVDLAYADGRLATATDGMGRTLTFEYVGERLSSIRLPAGTVVSYDYDSQGNLTAAHYPSGSTRTYHYNESGLSDANDPYALTGLSNNGIRFATFAYDAYNRARLTQHHDGNTAVERIQLVYGQNGTVQVTGSNGEQRNYAVAARGGYRRATSIVHGDGTASTTFNGAMPFEHTDKLGSVTRYEFTNGYESARYEAYGTPLERKISTVRDAAYRITSSVVAEKLGTNYVAKSKTLFVHNARGQTTARCDIDTADAVAMAYDCASTALAPAGVRKTKATYCEQTDVDSGTCPIVGLVTGIDGPRQDVSDVTTYSYYGTDAAGCSATPASCGYRKGDLFRITNALGQATETLSYDSSGRPTVRMDANGVVSVYEYDAEGRMTMRKVLGPDDTTEADDRIVRVEHWPAGQVKKVTQADGTSTIYTYDTAQRLVRVADNAGNAIEYTLDGSSNRVREDTRESTGELRQQLARTYDLLGNLRTEVDAYQHATTYVTDAAGRVDTVTNALNRVSDDDYDLLGRRVRSIHDRDGIASQSRYEYDIFDRVTRVVDPKDLSTSYTYDAFGNVTRLESPDTGVTINAYDIAGNRSRSVDANGKIIDYRYDVLNRLKTVDYAAAVPDQTYAYDVTMADCPAGENFGVGRKTRFLDESGYTNFCYNRFGDLVRKIQRTGNSTLIMRWQYAANGRLLKEIRPGNVEIDYGYDAVGRITEIGVNHGTGRAVLLSGASYYPFGPAAQWTYGNGRGMTRELDLNYDVRRIVSTGVDGLDYAFDVDEVGNLVELRHASTNALLRTYGYDGLDRLSSERIGGSSSLLREYTYDKTGNRTATSRLVAVDGDSTYQTVWFNNSYASDSHRLIHDGTDPRDYDDAGNLTRVGAPSSAHSTFSYNEGNRLSAISRGTTAAVYAYNAVGERVRRSVNGIDTLSLYDASGQWIADYDGQGVSAQQVIWLGNLPVGVVVGYRASSKLYYVEPDALGTPRAVVDPTRDVAVWRWPLESEAFGADAPDPDADADGVAFTFDMRFPGQRFDAASGLNYNYYRDYESSTGRYVESDPIGLSGGLSTYSYVSSKPLESTDPFGQRGRRGTPHDDDWLKSARNDAISALDNCNMKDCDPANPYAISQQQLDEIKQKVKSADIKFDGDNKDCGESMPNDQPNLIRIGRAMISGGNCCSVASVVAHEATHLVLGHTAYENLNQIIEGKALFVQLKCFGCSNWYNYHASK